MTSSSSSCLSLTSQEQDVLQRVVVYWKEKEEEADKEPPCVLQYDPVDDHGYLTLRKQSDRDCILKMVAMDDVIGANLAIEMLQSPLQDNNSMTKKNAAALLSSVSSSLSLRSSSRAENEPSSDVLQDTKAVAVVTLYHYPKMSVLLLPLHVRVWKWLAEAFVSVWLLTLRVLLCLPCLCSSPSSSSNNKKTKKKKTMQQAQVNLQEFASEHARLRATIVPRHAQHVRFTLAPAEDLQDAGNLVALLQRLAHAHAYLSSNSSPAQESESSDTNDNDETAATTTNLKKSSCLLLVNPRSGPHKNAVELAQTIVIPLLEQSGRYETIHMCASNYARHAADRCAEKPLREPNTTATEMKKDGQDEDPDHECLDLSYYDDLLVMGGDGTVHEAINGICNRKSDAAQILSKLRVGVLGCGTCNGFSSSVAFASNEQPGLFTDTFLCCKGKTVQSDLSHYFIQHNRTSTTTTATTESFVEEKASTEKKSDSTASSEQQGSSNGKQISSYTSFLTFTWAMIADIDIESEVIHWLGEPRNDVWAVWRVLNLRYYKATFSYLPVNNSDSSSSNNSQTEVATAKRELPAFGEPVPSDWITLQDDFILFWASHVSHAALHTNQAPQCKFGDGYFHIFLLRKSSNLGRLQIARILLALEKGQHVHMRGVECLEALQYRLEPHTAGSFNDVDGEVCPVGPVQAAISPIPLTVFAGSR